VMVLREGSTFTMLWATKQFNIHSVSVWFTWIQSQSISSSMYFLLVTLTVTAK
jgi:hypothetical protein